MHFRDLKWIYWYPTSLIFSIVQCVYEDSVYLGWNLNSLSDEERYLFFCYQEQRELEWLLDYHGCLDADLP